MIGPPMKINLGLSDDVCQTAGQVLNFLLADEYMLYATTHDYHWNVTGPDFHGLHLLFEAQYEEIHESLDDIAERIRALGVGARGNWADLTKSLRLSAERGIGLSPELMLSGLLGLHEKMIVQLRTDATRAATLGDLGTADFITGLLRQHEKAAWMIRSHLEVVEQSPT